MVVILRIQRQLVGEVLAAQEPAGVHVQDQPGRSGQHRRLPVSTQHPEIAHVKRAVEALVPGLQLHQVFPARHVQELDVHAGENPGRAETLQRLEAETQGIGRHGGQVLGQVHESARFQVVGHIGIIAGHGKAPDGHFIGVRHGFRHFFLKINDCFTIFARSA